MSSRFTLKFIDLHVGLRKGNNLGQNVYNPQILHLIPLIFNLSVHVPSVAALVCLPVVHNVCDQIVL